MSSLTDLINEATRRVEIANKEEAKAFQARLGQAEKNRADRNMSRADAESALMEREPQNELEAFAQATIRRRAQQEAHDAEKRQEEEARQSALRDDIAMIAADRRAAQEAEDAERRQEALEDQLLLSRRTMRGIIEKAWNES